MSEVRQPKPRIYPTRRLAAAFAAGSVWFFAVPWLGNGMIWLGAGYALFLLVMAVIDCVWVMDSRQCSVTRLPESVLSLGEENPIWLEVNHAGKQSVNVLLQDEPPLEFETELSSARVNVNPDEIRRVNYKVSPKQRGDYMFGNLNARYTTRLGLVTRQETVLCEMPVKVYPDVFQTKKLLILARENRVAMMGLRKSRMLGQGREFERLRDYVPDDSLRHIDWKASARRGSLITREYDVEHSQNIMIMIDMGRTMASRTEDLDGKMGMSKADYAINASVLLTHVAAQSDDRIGLFCFAGSPIAFVPPGKGASQASALMEALYVLQPRTEESNYYDNLVFISHKQTKRSLVFLFTDLVDAESSRLLIKSIGLLVRKHLVVCVALADYELPSIVDAMPAKASDIYTQTVAAGIIRERKSALAKLANMGVITIDATPADLSIAAVNKYLQLKREARL